MPVRIPAAPLDHGEPPVWGVVLAAGSSRRMGRDKALLPWGDEPLLVAHLRAFRAAGLRPVVILRHLGGPVARVVEGATVVATRGRTASPWASVALALRTLPATKGAVVTPVDVPPPPSCWSRCGPRATGCRRGRTAARGTRCGSRQRPASGCGEGASPRKGSARCSQTPRE